MSFEEIKNMPTSEQWNVIKTHIPEVQHYADKTGYSKRAGAELVKAGYEAGIRDAQRGNLRASR